MNLLALLARSASCAADPDEARDIALERLAEEEGRRVGAVERAARDFDASAQLVMFNPYRRAEGLS